MPIKTKLVVVAQDKKNRDDQFFIVYFKNKQNNH